mmetsp:Transcript_106392/g.227204  ORF Transcript_106392/g.227204 Transcript_106392/m.227204 type:complete len:106 (+) Transcript_106392:3-320(+)
MSLLPEEKRLPEEAYANAPQPASMPVAYLCHEACQATAGIFHADGGHITAARWQADEAFVDFDPKDDQDGALEDVAGQWPEMARWDKVSYRGDERHARALAADMN